MTPLLFSSDELADLDGSGDIGLNDIYRYINLYFKRCS